MTRHRSPAVAGLLVAGMLLSPAVALAGFNGDAGAAGAGVSLTEQEFHKLNAEYEQLRAKPGPRLEYQSVLAPCNQPVESAGEVCLENAVKVCVGNPASVGVGPMMEIRRRWVDPSGDPVPAPGETTPSDWVSVGTTCQPDLVPGVAKRPSMAMIINAFHRTPWAKGTISTQPTGDVTLVNLKTFYRVNWSAAGFEPGEVESVDPATMYGYRVEVRPKLVSYVYHYGDGTSSEPTTSPGGIYPDGDVTHTYTQRGTFTSRVDVTFGADFRINGGGWVEIPDTVTVAQPGTVVTVKEARAVLVNE